MAAPTVTLPVLATDGTFTSGEFSGTASKVELTASELAQGFRPKDRPPARKLNWLFNAIGQWLSYLVDRDDLQGRAIGDLYSSITRVSNLLPGMLGTNAKSYVHQAWPVLISNVTRTGNGVIEAPMSAYGASTVAILPIPIPRDVQQATSVRFKEIWFALKGLSVSVMPTTMPKIELVRTSLSGLTGETVLDTVTDTLSSPVSYNGSHIVSKVVDIPMDYGELGYSYFLRLTGTSGGTGATQYGAVGYKVT